MRLGYYEHIAAEPLPSIAVIQDIDMPDTGFGGFWGEPCPQRARLRRSDHRRVAVAVGMNDVVRRDRHPGDADRATVIDEMDMGVRRHDRAGRAPENRAPSPRDRALIARRERVIIEASKAPGFSVARLRQAFGEIEDQVA